MATLPTSINDQKTINGWAMFDWANSAYALVITVAIFPAYFSSLSEEPVMLIGRSYMLPSLFSYAISLAYLLIALCSPLLSGIADASGRKLYFLRVFTLFGSLGCIGMWFFKGIDQLGIGTLLFMVATIGYSGALVFYNAFLPQIASEDRQDDVSAKGFSYGYIGSVLLLIVCLVMILKPSLVGLSPDATGTATRISFVLVGLWWLGFAQFSFSRLPKDDKQLMPKGWLKKGYTEISKTFAAAKTQPLLIRFLAAFFAYSAGVQTVLFLASTFAESELGFATTELIIVVLVLQIVAIAGAWMFAKVSGRFGNITALLIMLFVWIGICGLAYFVGEKSSFYAIAGLVGLVMGGIQSLSRSTYSKMIPEGSNDVTSYFSFYDLLEKLAIVIGTFSFGLINQLTGGMRMSMLSLIVFFLIGILLLWGVRLKSKKMGTAEPV